MQGIYRGGKMNFNWVFTELLNLMPKKIKSFTIEDAPVGYNFTCTLQTGETLSTEFWDLKTLALFLELNDLVSE